MKRPSCRAASAPLAAPIWATNTPCSKPSTVPRLRMMEEGRGDYANPASILKAAELMLRHIARNDAADRLLAAMDRCDVKITGRPDGATAAQYADAIMTLL